MYEMIFYLNKEQGNCFTFKKLTGRDCHIQAFIEVTVSSINGSHMIRPDYMESRWGVVVRSAM